MNQTILETEAGAPYPFGTLNDVAGTNFTIYTNQAQKLTLCLFNEKNMQTPFQRVELSPTHNKTGNIWHVFIKNLPRDTLYAYELKPIQEQDTSYLLLDPYAKCVASRPVWNQRLSGKETDYRPLGRVDFRDPFDWEGDCFPKIKKKDLIIYEMHVRGFTQSQTSQVTHPGTYLGLIEKIPFLKELGVNAVELMPIHEFNEEETLQTNPKSHEKLCNYFGYSTVNFFSPMARYASQAEAGKAILEFKTMVKELHKNGIEVILDVVFNHTFEGNKKGCTSSFRGLAPSDYYMIDNKGNYLNFSGCGNTLNTNNPIVIELIISALRYWVTEMHVDGFRFDLASIFTRSPGGAPLADPPVLEAISRDPLLAHTKLIAEPWDAGGLYQLGEFSRRNSHWSEWNGKYRDIVRCFIKGTTGYKSLFASVLCGSENIYGNGGSPQCSINFITAHDGFSLADLVSYNEKHNEVNGEENRDGFDHNDSWNCGIEGHSSNKKVVALRERQIRNFHLALMVSQGIPMLLMGDEYAHTRDGNNNTWCQDNDLNWFLWDQLDRRPGFFRYYTKLIHFRKNNQVFSRDAFLVEKDITWHGLHPFNPEWENDNRFLAFVLNTADRKPQIYVAFNASHNSMWVTLPHLEEGKSWHYVVNTHNNTPEDFFDNPTKVEPGNIRIHSYSSIMLQSL
jgi:isoamylase